MLNAGTEIFCFNNDNESFYSISSIKPSQRWATGIISETVNVVQVQLMAGENISNVKVIPTDFSPEEIISGVDTRLAQNLDESKAAIKMKLSEGEFALLKITDGIHRSTIYVRNSPPQKWWLN